MKRLTIVLAGFVAMGSWAAYAAIGQDGPGKNGEIKKDVGAAGAGAAGKKEGDPKRPKLFGEGAKMLEVCGLSDDQQKSVGDLIDAREKEIRDVQAKYQALIMDVLTAEQKAKWSESRLLSGLQWMIQKAGLTDEQVGKIKAAIPKLAPDGLPTDERGRNEVQRKLMEFVSKEVMTDEQKKAMFGGDGPRKGAPAKDGEVRKDGQPMKEGNPKKEPPNREGDKPVREGELPPL